MALGEEVCSRCQAVRTTSVFCRVCNLFLEKRSDGSAQLSEVGVERATFTRRILGSVLLEAALLIITLVVGWLIWLYFTAKTAQSPAKRLTNLYLISREQYPGKDVYVPASAGRVWLREVGLKIILLGLLDSLLSGIPTLVDYAWAAFNGDRKAIHDEIAKTLVVYAPSGLGPATQEEIALAPQVT